MFISHLHSFADCFLNRAAFFRRSPNRQPEIFEHPRQSPPSHQFPHRDLLPLHKLSRQFAAEVWLLQPRENLLLARNVDAMRTAIAGVRHVELPPCERPRRDFAQDEQRLLGGARRTFRPPPPVSLCALCELCGSRPEATAAAATMRPKTPRSHR